MSRFATTARGRWRKGGQRSGMNRTEAAYAAHLELRKRALEIVWYGFEAVKYKLADNTFYTPDFLVMTAEGFIEAHEVKGFWEDDARVKIKVAAELFPVRFVAVRPVAKKRGGGWTTEEI